MSLTLAGGADRPCRNTSRAARTPVPGTSGHVASRVGDKVFHHREGDNPGTVVGIRRPWWALFGRVYWVQWREGVLPVPMHTGLRPVPDTRQARREAGP
ncbi:hypothetical protein [Streptomyces sp. ADI98-10]|uniref:hypothetical protein n=1 Tax=Streptomyces sp. ADI98-10 TaxID=1522763 RepID=UPI000F55797E|nr:hypothetical protein [Streptomyces sp. ADI98-10]RPK93487.1 hypothetical protein EES46_06005 [Streptomyces sp. ADI98-10]